MQDGHLELLISWLEHGNSIIAAAGFKAKIIVELASDEQVNDLAARLRQRDSQGEGRLDIQGVTVRGPGGATLT